LGNTKKPQSKEVGKAVTRSLTELRPEGGQSGGVKSRGTTKKTGGCFRAERWPLPGPKRRLAIRRRAKGLLVKEAEKKKGPPGSTHSPNPETPLTKK